MDRAIRQLNQVRRFGRLLLFVQRATQWLSLVVAAALACGVVDYALRLPWWLRLSIGLAIAVSACTWLARWVSSAIRFQPALTSLALRAEKLFPQLSGSLASAVEFAADPGAYSPTPKTAALAQASIGQASARLGGVPLVSLIAPAKTVRWLAIAMASLLVSSAVCLAAPEGSFRIAWQRWLMPLGDARWPTRYEVESLVTEQVAPFDQPLQLEAHVVRGYREGMRTWVHHRTVRPGREPGQWRTHLMRERTDAATAAGRFERMLDLSKQVAMLLPEAYTGPMPQVGIDCYFEAGDHRSEPQHIRLVQRPGVRELHVAIEPPEYARGIVAGRTVPLVNANLAASPLVTTSALRGAAVRLRIHLNKPMAWSASMLAATVPGIAQEPGVQVRVLGHKDTAEPSDATVIELSLRLDRTIRTPIHLKDAYGLSNMSERIYQVRAVEDAPPTASMLTPAVDESVLATAVVPLKTRSQDDVGMAWLHLEALLPTRLAEGESDPTGGVLLAEHVGHGHRLEIEHQLDLQGFTLRPGDEVELSALAQDIFELDGQRHEPQRSAVRRLKIIEPSALIRQLRSELGGVRQTAVRIDAAQRDASELPARSGEPRQRHISGRVQNQSAVVETLRQRIARNRLDAPQLQALVDQVAALSTTAAQASKAAAGRLQKANRSDDEQAKSRSEGEARREQLNVREALGELITLLDQSRDVQTLQLKLKQIAGAQQGLATDTRQMLPHTAALSRDELSPKQSGKLDDMSNTQSGLEQQAKALVEQMQATADALSRQSRSAADQAAAAALAEAASIALRQGLGRSMKQASQRIGQNRLSQAGEHQQDSLEVIRQMLEQLNEQDRRRQQILRRRLAELAASIERLIEQQTSHIERLKGAADVAELAPSLATMRVNTLAVEQQARGAEQPPVADLLGRAAEHQAAALASLRTDQKAPASAAEGEALAKLVEALALVRQQQEKLESDTTSKQRGELRAEYEKLAALQMKLRDRTVPLIGPDRLERREKLALREIGDGQADVRISAAKLGEKMQDTTLFKHAHLRIDELAQQAAASLRSAQVADRLLDDQAWIASTLRRMAAALKQDPDEDEFSKGAGGGSGGGGGGAAPLAGSLAELKLLRGLQEEIYDRTKALDARRAQGAAGKEIEAQYRVLAREQGELKRLGQRLIKNVQSDMDSLEQRLIDLQRRPGQEQ